MIKYLFAIFDDFVVILMKNLISNDRTYLHKTLNLSCTTLIFVLQLIFFKSDQYERSISKHGYIRDVTWSRCSPEQQELKCFLARVYLLPVESTSYYWSVGNKNNDLLISSTDISCVWWWWCGQYPLLARGLDQNGVLICYVFKKSWMSCQNFFLIDFLQMCSTVAFCTLYFWKKIISN